MPGSDEPLSDSINKLRAHIRGVRMTKKWHLFVLDRDADGNLDRYVGSRPRRTVEWSSLYCGLGGVRRPSGQRRVLPPVLRRMMATILFAVASGSHIGDVALVTWIAVLGKVVQRLLHSESTHMAEFDAYMTVLQDALRRQRSLVKGERCP